ncbi:SusE domain-containing protein [Sphingobacterium sp. HMA12]|uniref:SusE domain-containing protein n=1 Tax=Sphingobacterium sp. HMA12 TaxID=2050894 RepID=UPI0013154B3C|nr:SusE domain-containing protein [Sphingobacterium sp. HMA12]
MNDKIKEKDMKWYFKVIAMIVLAAGIVSCKKDDMKYSDADVSAVENLYAPADGKSVKLLSSSSAALYFEWESALVADGGAAQYEVVFDKVDGDFSKPLYTVTSDNNGNSNGANISHKILNQVAAKAGIEPGTSGDVSWSVYSIRGMKRVLGKVKKVLNIKSLEGFADIPDELFITGEGTEGGEAITQALPFKLVGNGEYEIFTKLEAGKKYTFTDRKSADGRIFYSEDQTKLKESDAGSNTVTKTAVYRIRIDFNVATITYAEIKSMGVYFSPSGAVVLDLPYQGKGIWSATGIINFKQESWGRDQRYKFQMETVRAGKAETVQLGTQKGTDVPPNGADPTYFFVRILPNLSQWDDKWKFVDAVDGHPTKISMILQGDKDYTHAVVPN